MKRDSSQAEVNNDKADQTKNGDEHIESSTKGVFAWLLDSMVHFIQKPWQLAIPELQLKNKYTLITLSFLIISGNISAFSIYGDKVSIFEMFSESALFWFYIAFFFAATIYVTGVSAKLGRISLAILMLFLALGIYTPISEMVELLKTGSDLCVGECKNLIKSLLGNTEIRKELFNTIDFGTYFFIFSFFSILFKICFHRYSENKALRQKLSKINQTKVDAKPFSETESFRNFSSFMKKTSVQAKDSIGHATSKMHMPEIEEGSKAANALEQIAPYLTKRNILISIFLLLIFILVTNSISEVEHPSRNEVQSLLEQEILNDPNIQLASLFSKNLKPKITLEDYGNCEEHEFEDGDIGISCDLSIKLKLLGEMTEERETALFYKENDKWSYQGSL